MDGNELALSAMLIQELLLTMEASGQSVEVQMRNVMYHFTDDIIVHIRKLRGKLAPKGHNLPIFDDKESFTLQIASAEIAMTPGSLANVLNSYVFSGRDAPLKNISIRIEKGRLKVKGKLHSKGDISFETEGQLSATPDGKIRMHTEKVKAIISEQLGVDEAEVTTGASFVDDLGADSLDRVELVMALEEAFDLEIPDEDAEKISTVQGAIDYVEKHAKVTK